MRGAARPSAQREALRPSPVIRAILDMDGDLAGSEAVDKPSADQPRAFTGAAPSA
jgi:hypothetical protein